MTIPAWPCDALRKVFWVRELLTNSLTKLITLYFMFFLEALIYLWKLSFATPSRLPFVSYVKTTLQMNKEVLSKKE